MFNTASKRRQKIRGGDRYSYAAHISLYSNSYKKEHFKPHIGISSK